MSTDHLVVKQWQEYFEELYSMLTILNSSVHFNLQTVEIYDKQPSLEEVKKVINYLKNDKAAGLDQIIAELLKYSSELLK